jgi:hypothetical protein
MENVGTFLAMNVNGLSAISCLPQEPHKYVCRNHMFYLLEPGFCDLINKFALNLKVSQSAGQQSPLLTLVKYCGTISLN